MFKLIHIPSNKASFSKDQNDEYAYRIPNPKHTPKYTKAKVLHAQNKHTQLSSLAELLCHPINSHADANLPEFVDHTHYRLATCAFKNLTRITEFGGIANT